MTRDNPAIEPAPGPARHASVAEPALSLVVAHDRATLRARGSDGVAWLNGLVTCDLKKLAPGRGAFGLLLTKTGKIRTDVDVVAGAGELLLGVGREVAESVRSMLDAHLVMEDVELELAPELAWVRLLGGAAPELADAFAPAVLAHGAIDWLGIGGAALVVPAAGLELTLERIAEAGPPGTRRLDADGWDELRLRHGFPLFGRDYGGDDNPHEAALDRRAVSWDKGCYLGQEVVCMQDMRGRVKRRLVVLELELDADDAPGPGSPVLAAGQGEVGVLRSVHRAEGGSLLAFARLISPYFDDSSAAALSVAGRPARIVTLAAAANGASVSVR